MNCRVFFFFVFIRTIFLRLLTSLNLNKSNHLRPGWGLFENVWLVHNFSGSRNPFLQGQTIVIIMITMIIDILNCLMFNCVTFNFEIICCLCSGHFLGGTYFIFPNIGGISLFFFKPLFQYVKPKHADMPTLHKHSIKPLFTYAIPHATDFTSEMGTAKQVKSLWHVGYVGRDNRKCQITLTC